MVCLCALGGLSLFCNIFCILASTSFRNKYNTILSLNIFTMGISWRHKSGTRLSQRVARHHVSAPNNKSEPDTSHSGSVVVAISDIDTPIIPIIIPLVHCMSLWSDLLHHLLSFIIEVFVLMLILQKTCQP